MAAAAGLAREKTPLLCKRSDASCAGRSWCSAPSIAPELRPSLASLRYGKIKFQQPDVSSY